MELPQASQDPSPSDDKSKSKSRTGPESMAEWLVRPQRWSLPFLFVLILSVASTCSFLIHTLTVLYVAPRVEYAYSLRSNFHLAHGFYPRLLFLTEPWEPQRSWFASRRMIEPLFPRVKPSPQVFFQERYDPQCIPKADWHQASFPNCNSIHEINLLSAAEINEEEEQLHVLGEGWFRTTWQLTAHNASVVLKTLRIERDFLQEYYELHRRDALTMERLTWSDFVVNVYGYCGQSALNELADFPYQGIKDLETFDRRLRGRYTPTVYKVKLQLAASVAQGLADIHAIDGADQGATMVHYDINPRNIALFAQGRPKINDFNIAELLRYNPATNKTCGFPNRMHQPWWRAPEEVSLTRGTVLVDEKVDIYALGGVLFHILTTHSPRGKMKPEFQETVRAAVEQGMAPTIPPPFDTEQNVVTVAFRKAMARCFEKDPVKRASAQEIVEILLDALMAFLDSGGNLEPVVDGKPATATKM